MQIYVITSNVKGSRKCHERSILKWPLGRIGHASQMGNVRWAKTQCTLRILEACLIHPNLFPWGDIFLLLCSCFSVRTKAKTKMRTFSVSYCTYLFISRQAVTVATLVWLSPRSFTFNSCEKFTHLQQVIKKQPGQQRVNINLNNSKRLIN